MKRLFCFITAVCIVLISCGEKKTEASLKEDSTKLNNSTVNTFMPFKLIDSIKIIDSTKKVDSTKTI